MDNKKPVFAIPCPDFLTTGKCNLACKYCFEKDKVDKELDMNLVMEYLDHNPLSSAMLFGGEPLMAIDKICQIIDAIENNPHISKNRKEETIKKARTIITNGTLIPQNIEKIKKYKLFMQISFDGCKEANDKNRVYANGKGTYDNLIESIKCCAENDIDWSIHGVITKETVSYIFETFEEFFNLYVKYHKGGIDYAVDHLKHNSYQLIFEDEYTDDDVDIVIEQFGRIAEWIMSNEELTDEQKEALFQNWFFKHGSICGVGSGLLALDDKLNIYPCHRTVFGLLREKTHFGDVFHPEDLKNYHLLNAYHNLGRKRRYMYSVATNIDIFKNKGYNSWFMWCPSTNLQVCNNPYFQPVKYNIMFTELNRFINTLKMAYFGSRRLNNSNSSQRCSS